MPSLSCGSCSLSLTPLQSKFVASLFATTVLVLVLFLVSFPRPAYSFDGGSSIRLGIPLNGRFDPVLAGGRECSIGGEEGDGGGGVSYWERDALGWEDLEQLEQLEKKDNEIVRGLGNGVPGRYNMLSGEINYWLLEPTDLFGDDLKARDDGGNVKRQDQESKVVYITFNTCLQPQPNAALPQNQRPTSPPPALVLYMSNTTENQAPGPSSDGPQTIIPVIGGFGNLTINATGSIWIGVYAPPADDINDWEGVWNYELVLSTTKPYHGYIDDQFLYLVDTDNSAALLITGNMTTTSSSDGGIDEDVDGDELLTRLPPYTMYAQNTGFRSRFEGLERSYCAVYNLAETKPGSLDVSMTTRGLGNMPKQQFHLKELNRSSTYLGFLTRPGSNTSNSADTSGTLWRPINLMTKGDGNCQIIYNLPFCSEVAYAVPSNPTLFSMSALTSFYDNIAVNWYKNFSYSIQQIQCNSSKAAAYSLARNCTDCENAYKTWLCAVTIPRCEDWTSDLPYLAKRASSELFYNGTTRALQPHPFEPPLTTEELDARNTSRANSTKGLNSRNKEIDVVVRPGPYKEVKPCRDLCWTLVQNCPSQFGFSCPHPESWGGMESYGERSGGDVTCSYLGAVYFLSAAGRIADGLWWGGGGMWWVLGMVVWFAL